MKENDHLTQEEQKERFDEIVEKTENDKPKMKYGCLKMTSRYGSLASKIWASHSEYVCFFCMMLATILNGGILYLMYPFMIFAFTMTHETRPGACFWYTVIYYTQVLIFLNFVVQLQVWQLTLDSDKEKDA